MKCLLMYSQMQQEGGPLWPAAEPQIPGNSFPTITEPYFKQETILSQQKL